MKYSLRDLFLVTVIVALAVGWWVDRKHQAQHRSTFDKQMESLYWQEGNDPLHRYGKLPKHSPAPNP
jgi:hypothetical protein